VIVHILSLPLSLRSSEFELERNPAAQVSNQDTHFVHRKSHQQTSDEESLTAKSISPARLHTLTMRCEMAGNVHRRHPGLLHFVQVKNLCSVTRADIADDQHESNRMNKSLTQLAWLMSAILLMLVAVAASAQTGNQGAKASPAAPEQATTLPVPQSPPLSPSSATPSPAPAPVSALENPETAPDSAAITAAESELQAQIQNAIGKDPTLSGSSVSVAVSAEGIELSGSVTSGRARLAASRIAKSYAGSKKVVDKITVSLHTGDAPAEPTPEKINSAGARLRP
jgi:hypothetical protein